MPAAAPTGADSDAHVGAPICEKPGACGTGRIHRQPAVAPKSSGKLLGTFPCWVAAVPSLSIRPSLTGEPLGPSAYGVRVRDARPAVQPRLHHWGALLVNSPYRMPQSPTRSHIPERFAGKRAT